MGSRSPQVVCRSVFRPDAKKMLHTATAHLPDCHSVCQSLQKHRDGATQLAAGRVVLTICSG